MLIDSFGRPLKSLRISVTSRCNYRCVFCHNEGIERRDLEELTPSEIGIIVKIAMELGINEFKLTGGEPLVRLDIVDIVKHISMYRPRDLSMTTNGYYLKDLAAKLAEAGLMRVNINIPTLNNEKYVQITGVNGLKRVLEGIEEAYNNSLKPIAINMVLLRNINEDEVDSFIELASRYEAKLRIIELEPISIPKRVFEDLYVSTDRVESMLRRRCSKIMYRDLHRRPIYVLDNGVEVEIVKWYGNPVFCAHCYRARLTPNGVLKPCILSREGIDLKPYLRPKPDPEKIKEMFIRLNSMRKPFNILNTS